MSQAALLLFFLTIISVVTAYLLVFNPQKNARFMGIANRLTLHTKQVFFIILIGISAIPSIFIIEDRWLRHPMGIGHIASSWWDVLVGLPLAYPRYFFYIFGLALCIGPIVFLWQKLPVPAASDMDPNQPDKLITGNRMDETSQRTGNILVWASVVIVIISAVTAVFTNRIPGWELVLTLGIYIYGWVMREYGYNEVRQYLANHAGFLIDVTAFVISFCGVLYVLSGETQHVLIFHLLFFLTSLNLNRKKIKMPAVFWISIISLAALTWKINGWEYVVIGDEYSFYDAITDGLDHLTIWESINTTFNGSHVFGSHPYFSSHIHAFFMKIFGYQNFGWRFSNPFLVASSLFFFNYFFEYFTQKRIASITTILLAFSHYLLSFSKIGYNNLQAFFALGLVLAAFTWSLKSMKLISFSFLGLSMGFCFYVYPAALYVLPLPFLGLLIYLPPVNQASIKRWGWMIFSILLLIHPLFIQPTYWKEKMPGTIMFTQTGHSGADMLHNMISNTIYSLFSYLYIPEESHYISTGYFDPLSGFFIVFGASIIMRMVFARRKAAIFLFIGFAILSLLVGVTHGREFPPATRMFLILPCLALLAAYGIDWVSDKLSLLFNFRSDFPLMILLGGIILFNFYNAYIIDIQRSTQYHNTQSLFIKTVHLIEKRNDIAPKSYYFVTEEYWNVDAMKRHQQIYLVPQSFNQLINLSLTDNHLPPDTEEIVRDENSIIIIRALVNDSTLKNVDTQLHDWGKFMCEVKNGDGVVLFQLWHSRI